MGHIKRCTLHLSPTSLNNILKQSFTFMLCHFKFHQNWTDKDAIKRLLVILLIQMRYLAISSRGYWNHSRNVFFMRHDFLVLNKGIIIVQLKTKSPQLIPVWFNIQHPVRKCLDKKGNRKWYADDNLFELYILKSLTFSHMVTICRAGYVKPVISALILECRVLTINPTFYKKYIYDNWGSSLRHRTQI